MDQTTVFERERQRLTGLAGEVVLADTVGIALQHVLDSLTPKERVSFILHDSFSSPSTRSPSCSDRRRRPRASWPHADA